MISETIQFYRRNVYGKELEYVRDEKEAEAIRLISGQKTLTPAVRQGLEGLGHKFIEMIAPTKK